MIKKIRLMLCCTLITTILANGLFPYQVMATPQASGNNSAAGENSNDTDAAAANTRPAVPECYNWPIQSNDLPGWPQGPQIQAETAIVMEADTGAILYAKGVDEKREPASITKIMTTLVALEHSTMNEQVTFSHDAVFNIEPGSTHIGIKEGEVLTMEQCIYGVMLASANEVSNGVAEHVGGSIEGFTDMMNAKAKELGCKNTNFANPNGLHNDEHYTSAYDMALITQAALKNPSFRKITATDHYIIPTTNITNEERWLNNHHKMLRQTPQHYDGCIGGKTGYTTAAGNTLVTVADKNGMELICVTLKSNSTSVYSETAQLLDYGFDNFQKVELCKKQQLTSAKILPFDRQFYSGKTHETIGEYKENTYAVIPGDIQADTLKKNITCDKNLEKTEYFFQTRMVAVKQLFVPTILKAAKLKKALDETASSHGSSTTNLVSSFQKLPSWKYPALGLLAIFLIFYLVLLILKLRKRRKKKKRKRRKNK